MMFSKDFSILVISVMYPVSCGDHHGDAVRPGSFSSERCHTEGNKSRPTASPYSAKA